MAPAYSGRPQACLAAFSERHPPGTALFERHFSERLSGNGFHGADQFGALVIQQPVEHGEEQILFLQVVLLHQHGEGFRQAEITAVIGIGHGARHILHQAAHLFVLHAHDPRRPHAVGRAGFERGEQYLLLPGQVPQHRCEKAIELPARAAPVLMHDGRFGRNEQVVAGAMVLAQKVQNRSHRSSLFSSLFVLLNCNRILISLKDSRPPPAADSMAPPPPLASSLNFGYIISRTPVHTIRCSTDYLYRPLSQHGDHSENNPLYPPDSGRLSCVCRTLGGRNAAKWGCRPGRNAANDENLLAGTAPESDGASS